MRIRIERGRGRRLVPAARKAAGLAAIVVAAAVSACAPTAADSDFGDPAAPSRTGEVDVEADVFARVNAIRRQSGQPPLRESAALEELARAHTLDMAAGRVPFGHGGVDARLAAAAASVGGRRAAESVAYQRRPPEKVGEFAVARWLASTAHRKNLLGAYAWAGVSAVHAPDGRWFVTWIVAGP